ncbi:ribosome recycling factor [Dolosicoccus paucivorans]|uniref:Ribosome-recycling factor n=1 Tax=Dolosicoccus paucivorans TaxID=84521 RepID=A0A1G8KM12_9LACT|nr:ribosome recycling factor [Dolosicoccus paucivorans]PMB83579.1 ribosome recycling factor [Dolosicoccus paucivorans]PMC58170.1 ribosome recycling factor [Dolosicoccus paucivorans]SDI44454.1 ribosome recycling factor [Dolosicoccus paucivorans]
MANAVLNDTRQRMRKSIESFQRELGTIRAGVANASILDRVEVLYYGAPTPLNQLASITIPEARMLLISPYDKGSLGDIEKAILKSDVGITPNNDGEVIRLVIPALTQDRRRELTKIVGAEQENAKVAVRNIRRDAINAVKKEEKDGNISEDELRQLEKDIQAITDESVKEIDELSKAKESEILND